MSKDWKNANPKNGYKTYQCPKCGTKKYVPFTCKCRLCTSCGTKAANEWADRIIISSESPSQACGFTVSDKMRELLKNPKYRNLFVSFKITMEEMVASSNKKSEKKTKLKIGMIKVLQTFGADMNTILMYIVLSLKVVLTGNGIGSIPITCHSKFWRRNGSINY